MTRSFEDLEKALTELESQIDKVRKMASIRGDQHAAEGPALAGIPVDFILFGATLIGVALFHHHTLAVALTGLAAMIGAFAAAYYALHHPAVGGLDGLLSNPAVTPNQPTQTYDLPWLAFEGVATPFEAAQKAVAAAG